LQDERLRLKNIKRNEARLTMLGLGGSYKDALKSNETKATHQVKLTELNQEQVVGDSRENNTVDQGNQSSQQFLKLLDKLNGAGGEEAKPSARQESGSRGKLKAGRGEQKKSSTKQKPRVKKDIQHTEAQPSKLLRLTGKTREVSKKKWLVEVEWEDREPSFETCETILDHDETMCKYFLLCSHSFKHRFTWLIPTLGGEAEDLIDEVSDRTYFTGTFVVIAISERIVVHIG
jgi:hypothetical protein